MELNRIMSHLVWLGTSALDLGAMSMFWYCFRDRELILDLFEQSSGQRMHTRYFQVGGVAEDIPRGWVEKCREFTKQMPGRADQYNDLLAHNEIVLQRLRGVCPLGEPELLELGVTGPLLRAAGNPWDLRKAMPYCSYEDFDFKIPVGVDGDNWDRFAVRVAEIYESVKIIDQALDGLPEGPWITDDRKVALPPRHELATSMEALIHHFKLVTEGFRVPPGECYFPIESPRGELGVLRALRRLVEARARAHARPVVREPPGDRADDRGLLHRRPHRDARDARPGARGHRPLMLGRKKKSPQAAEEATATMAAAVAERELHGGAGPGSSARSRASATARACPAGTTPPTSRRTPPRSPTPRRRPSRRRCAPRSRRTWRSTRTSAAPRSPRSPPPSATTAGARPRRSSRPRASCA